MIDSAGALQVYAAGTAIPLAGRAENQAVDGQAAGGRAAFSALLEREAARAEDSAPRRPVIDRADKLYEQCVELETFLLKTLVKGMRSTVMKSRLIDTGFAGEVYEDMLYDEYTKDLARNAGLGLAETAYLELTGQRGSTLENRLSLTV